MQQKAQSSIIQYAVFRWESALVLGLAIVLFFVYRRPFFWWPPFGWLLLGLIGFGIDSLFSAISENFYLNFISLYALAYGATNGQVGWVTATEQPAGRAGALPGARMVGASDGKPHHLISGSGFGRLALLLLALVPFIFLQPSAAIIAIVALNEAARLHVQLQQPGVDGPGRGSGARRRRRYFARAMWPWAWPRWPSRHRRAGDRAGQRLAAGRTWAIRRSSSWPSPSASSAR
ncbi:MAG: hypothetical protein R2851_24725 [Caldilineaceae bacterium]